MEMALEYRLGDVVNYKPRGVVNFYYETARNAAHYLVQRVKKASDAFMNYVNKSDVWYYLTKEQNEKERYEKPEGKD